MGDDVDAVYDMVENESHLISYFNSDLFETLTMVTKEIVWKWRYRFIDLRGFIGWRK